MKHLLKKTVALVLCLVLLLPVLPVFAADETPIDVKHWEERYFESFIGKTLSTLTKSNDRTHKSGNKTPINNLYDLQVVGEDYTKFSTFTVGSKKLNLIGNHASETGTQNMLVMDNESTGASGKGLVTLIPEATMAGLEEFTVSWVARCLRPNSGYAGLCLFYNNMETVNGIDYFGGYDNFTFAGYADYNLNNWAAFTVSGGNTKHFKSDSLKTQRDGSNQSIYASVHCTKGTYTVDGVAYTAKIESYSDDQLVSTSYAQWADAPVMFYYENPSSRWSVQITNIKLDAAIPVGTTVEKYLETAWPSSITGTSVRYSGGPGLRFYTTLEKDALYENATDVKTGVILLEKSLYQGGLTAETQGILLHNLSRKESEDDRTLCEIIDFTDPLIKDKIFYARSYACYTIEGKTFYSYGDVELAGCSRTAAKVVGKYESTKGQETMVQACRDMAGNNASVSVMSLNMMLAGDPKQVDAYGTSITWQQRMESAINMILDMSPDVIGLQEMVTASQFNTLMANETIAATYAYYGSKDDRGSGKSGEEGMYILYKKDRFDLVSEGVKYLSDAPDVPHSLFSDAKAYNMNNPKGSTFKPRKMVWTVLKHKETGEEMAFATTHLAFSASDTDLDYTVRNKQARLATKLLTGGELFNPDIPYVLMGDMNAKTSSDEYNVFLSAMEDVRYSAYKTASDTQGTYHYYSSFDSGTFIDHMFASKGDCCFKQFKIVTRSYKSESLGKSILPSDHYALFAEITVLPD